MHRSRRLFAVVSLGVLVAAGCSSSPRSQEAFCRQGPLLTNAKRSVDTADGGDLAQSKRRMAAFNQAVQQAVKVAPEELVPDIEPLGKLWAEINRGVQRARSTEEVSAATKDVLTERQSTYKHSSQAVNDYTDQHCTSTGGTK